jgi:hypothetical protein
MPEVNGSIVEEKVDNSEAFSPKEWMTAELTHFNVEREYEAEVQPLLRALEAKCHELGMPFYFRATTGQDLTGSIARTTCYMGGVGKATPDLIALQMLNVLDHEYLMALFQLLQLCGEKYNSAALGKQKGNEDGSE